MILSRLNNPFAELSSRLKIPRDITKQKYSISQHNFITQDIYNYIFNDFFHLLRLLITKNSLRQWDVERGIQQAGFNKLILTII